MKLKHLLCSLVFLTTLLAIPSQASNWFVRPDGGTRYSQANPNGGCDGTTDAAYPGQGTNLHCAFNDVRFLWTDGSYCTDNSAASTCWRWIGQGGDTYTIRGSISDGVTYRVGQSGPNVNDYLGLAGNPYGAGAPAPPSGTPTQHTQILGGNYRSCSASSARTQLHGGYGVWAVLNMAGASYVDVQCLDFTDFSSCGRSGQAKGCNTNFPLDDYATNGINWDNTATNDTLTNVRIHGLSAQGMVGPTGDGVVIDYIDIVGNSGAGWNADAGDGKTGVGKLLVKHYNISWNGCSEEYPIVDALPYQDCADDNSGGYGDGFGTATVASQAPGWQVTFDQGVVSYNTQDGLDALHLIGNGSSMTITRTLAYGNMGQQIKVGGAAGIAQNNTIYTNCNALRQPIPGTPAGYNSRLSDFCRAADAGLVMTVGKGATTTFENNTIYSASATGIEVDCDNSNGPCDATSFIRFDDNIFLGFPNNAADGYPNGGTGDFSNPIYIGVYPNPFANVGSTFDHNVTFGYKSNWTFPALWLNETNGSNVDPHLADETWHLYGYGDTQPLTYSPILGTGIGANNTGTSSGSGSGGTITSNPIPPTTPITPTPVVTTPPTVTALTLNSTTFSAEVGDQFVLTTTATYSDGTETTPTWVSFSSSNTSVATVESGGTVSAVGAGTATITATYNGVTSPGATVTVTQIPVTPVTPPPTTLVTSKTVIAKKQTGKSVQFTATVTGTGGVPTGMVAFYINGNPYGAAVTLSGNGQAKISVPSASLTMARVTASYSGDGKFAASTATIP